VQPLIEREVAVKIILPQYADHPNFIRRFEAEARLVARLEHPHIVPLYDYWREPGVAYLVMRLLRGGSLHALLKDGPLPLETVAVLLEQIGAALHAAHRVGVVHRDLKPANVLLDEDGNGYLADFGIAKNLSDPDLEDLTQAGAMVGSPAYSSPEQIRSDPVRPQADIYCLGVLIYELLTGDKPFRGPTPVDYMMQHLNEALPPLDAHPALDPVIQRAMAKDPLDRYPDIPSLLADFRQAVTGDSAVAVAMGEIPHRLDVTDEELENPYKGLRPFGEADADDFFGRETLVQELLGLMSEVGEPAAGARQDLARFLALVGPSGSGKSSLVKAGLIPALRKGGLPNSENWFIVDLMPGAHPLEELEAALLRVAVNPPESLLAQLQADERGLLRAVRRVLPADPNTELVLVIDQFEEVFTQVADEEVRAFLLDSLVTAVLDKRSRLRVVVTLRADFTGRALEYVDFGELVRQRTAFVLPLTPDELEQAIVGPATRAGLAVEPGLVATVVQDVGDQPGILPLLQYALTELFELGSVSGWREGRTLTLTAYRESGGVTGALSRRAEELYSSLEEPAQEAARQLFLRLVTLGEGTEDTRRRVLRTELSALQTSKVSETLEVLGVLDGVIDLYGQYRLLTFDNDPATRGPTVEVAHEALLREWGRLRGWLESSRADVQMERLLAAATAEWKGAGREPSYLLRGARLAQFEGWAEGSAVALTGDERAYLAASVAEREAGQAREQRGRNVLRGLQGVVAVAAVIAFVLAGVAFGQRQDARRQASIGLAAQALLELDGLFPERSVPLALEALESYPYTWQAERALGQAVLGSRLRLILQHGPSVNSARWSPDGTRILTASDDGTAKVWDASSGEELLTLAGHEDMVLSAEWSPSGDRLATASADGTGRVWNASSGEELTRLSCPYGCNVAVWAPTGKLIATGGVDGEESLDSRTWDATTGEELATLGHLNEGGPLGTGVLRWSPDGSRIACASGSQIRVWDATTGEALLTLTGHDDLVNQIAWSPEGSHIVSTSYDGTTKIWDVSTALETGAAIGEELLTFTGHTGDVLDVAWSPDGSRIVSGSFDNTARVWDVSTALGLSHRPEPVEGEAEGLNTEAVTGEALFVFHHRGWVELVAWSPDGSRIATSGEDNTVKVWDAATGVELLTFLAPNVVDMAWSPSSDRLLVASQDGTAKIRDLDPTLLSLPGREIQYFGFEMWSIRAAWSPTGDRVARGYEDGTAKVWGISTTLDTGMVTAEEAVILTGHTLPVYDITWSPSGDRIVTGGGDGKIKVWDATSGRELNALNFFGDEALVIKWSPDGRRIATASWEGLPAVWDLDTGTRHFSLVGHIGTVHDITWSPDGTRIATAGLDDGTAKVWDAATGQVIRDLYPEGSETSVRSVAWSPDGTRIATSGLSGCRIWDTRSGEELLSFGVDAFISWSHSGDRILGGSADGIARVWDADAGAELVRYDIGSPGTATWSPEGRRIATASSDGALKVFPAWQSTEDLIDYAKECCVVRELTDEEREQFGLPPR
jgi:WD40 repeat protein